MLIAALKRIAQTAVGKRAKPAPSEDDFLRGARGVIHVGANEGQERGTYELMGLHVLWIEPDPQVFGRLAANISPLPRQRAIEALVTDVDGAEYEFHVAGNWGLSSSILELDMHRDIWPDVAFVQDLRLTSRTLDMLMRDHHVDPRCYDCLVLDTQGSELLVLRGAEQTLATTQYVKVEVADFEAYTDCCKVDDISAFLGARGFRETARHEFARREGGGAYFDIVFQRQA